MHISRVGRRVVVKNSFAEIIVAILIALLIPVAALAYFLLISETPTPGLLLEFAIPVIIIVVFVSSKKVIQKEHDTLVIKQFIYSRWHKRDIILFPQDNPQLWYTRTGTVFSRFKVYLVKASAFGGGSVAYSISPTLAEGLGFVTSYLFPEQDDVDKLGSLLELEPQFKESVKSEIHELNA